jgi:hypothetical protein
MASIAQPTCGLEDMGLVGHGEAGTFLPNAAPPGADPGAKISACHGVGGMFAASGTIIMSNEVP